MAHALSVTWLPDDELLRRLADLLRQSRRVEADLVAHIAEVDRRRLYAREAAPSMFAYCTEVLRLSEAEAYARITVARASREHPVLLEMLADGRLHLTGIARLAPHLTPRNRDELLGLAMHKSRRQIEDLIADLAPRPDAPESMRRLPARRELAGSAVPDGGGERVLESPQLCPDRVGSLPTAATHRGGSILLPSGGAHRPSDDVSRADSERAIGHDAGLRQPAIGQEPAMGQHAIGRPPIGQSTVGDELAIGHPAAVGQWPDSLRPARAARETSPPALVQPLGGARYRVQFTAGAALHDKLRRFRALMRSQVPDGDLAALIEIAVTEKLDRLEARRFARTSRPRHGLAEADTSPSSRQIPAAVRRAVHERDGGRCRYVDTSGRRCSERDRLEYHHRHPYGMGGDHTPDNIRLMCRAHNTLLAEHDYGLQTAAQRRRSGDHERAATLLAPARRDQAPAGPSP